MKAGGRRATILLIDNDASTRELVAVDQSAPCMPVVFLVSNDEDRSRAQQLGDAYLVRPFFADELLRVVAGLLNWDAKASASP